MKEKLYTIPVNDAFSSSCECPICTMYKTLEDNSIEYTMGPSYMEDDVRSETDRLGFCDKHIKQVYHMDNRLGMAWVMKTHFDKTIDDVEKLQKKGAAKAVSLFKKNTEESPLLSYLHTLNSSCFVCERVQNVFMRYIDTIFMLWEGESDFREKYKNCNGFCNSHYEILLREASKKLRGSSLEEFTAVTDKLYLDNMKRVRDDLAWFINKFDYKYKDEPWKNARDSVIRSVTKTNSIIDVSEK